MNITTLKGELVGLLHGTTLNQVQGLNGIINRAARQILLDIDPQETKRTVQITNPLYDQVYDYAVPTDLKGNRVIDIKPQVQRTLRDRFSQQYNQDFDIYKNYTLTNGFTINFNGAAKTIKIDARNLNTGLTINEADSPTSNGTWTGSGTASDLTQETVNFAAGSGAIKFNLSNAGTVGYLENSTMSAIDMTAHENVSSIFYYVYIPTASAFTSFTIRWGSDSSNYWEGTSTTCQDGTSFQNGWNLLKVDWVNATKTGTPDVTAVNYVRVAFTYDGTTQTGCELDNIVSRKGVIFNIEYYSKYLFRDSSTNAFQETVTDDSNIINLDTETVNLLLYQVAYLIAQQMQGSDALRFDAQYWANLYQEDLKRYKGLYKSEVQKPQTKYYRQPNPSYRKFFGIRYWY